MKWEEFVSDRPQDRYTVETEFKWMRRYAFCYYRKIFPDAPGAEDFSQDTMVKFIIQLQERQTVTRGFYKLLVRYCFLDRVRAGKRDALKNRKDVHPDGADGECQLESLVPEEAETPQEKSLLASLIMSELDKVLQTFKPLYQQVILQRLIGVPAREISSQQKQYQNPITVNHINVIFHKFKSVMREACLNLELRPE